MGTCTLNNNNYCLSMQKEMIFYFSLQIAPGSLGGHGSPMSPSKRAFTSSLAPGGPVSPLHSPKPSLGSPKPQHNPLTSQAFEFLPSAAVSTVKFVEFVILFCVHFL